ncbi:MAG: hypothetical protein SCALA701_04070 [Candidatus Scalindua sp.]|nr:MAG: hypothetical protein SCALA701_04070 [Candidatus Scalindua sp.]
MLDTSKAQKEFGFKAKTSFKEGLTNTIEWYRESREAKNDQKSNVELEMTIHTTL